MNVSNYTDKLAVLFADICGSTKLYDHLGDELARRLVASCIACMVTEVLANQGTLIKTIGDEVMCTFPSAEKALYAASAMQYAVKNAKFETGVVLQVRIGFHYGDVICETGDVFGDTVNVAARVASAARANQIMTTQSVVNALPLNLKDKIHQIMLAEFKGKEEQYLIYIVSWEKDDEHYEQRTRFIPIIGDEISINNELFLQYGDQHLTVNKDCKSVIFGRADNCDIIVQNSFVSRQHVRFELRFGKFVIVDQSSNGSYIQQDGNVMRITREEMILQGSGFISLGVANFDDSSKLIAFSTIINLAKV